MAKSVIFLPNGASAVFDSDELSLMTAGGAMAQQPSGSFAPANGSPIPPAPMSGLSMASIRILISGPQTPGTAVKLVRKGDDSEPEYGAALDCFFDLWGGHYAELFKALFQITELIEELQPQSIVIFGERYQSRFGASDLWNCAFSWMKRREARSGGRNGGLTPTQRATAAPSSLIGLCLR